MKPVYAGWLVALSLPLLLMGILFPWPEALLYLAASALCALAGLSALGTRRPRR